MPVKKAASFSGKARPRPPLRAKRAKMDQDTEDTPMEIDEEVAALQLTEQPVASHSKAAVPSTSKATAGAGRASNKRPKTSEKPDNNNNSRTSISTGKRQKWSTTFPQYYGPGTLFAFGQNSVGQIGLDSIAVLQRKFPARVEELKKNVEGKDKSEIIKVKQVAAGSMHTIVLTSDEKVYTFGCNDDKALGRKTEEEEENAKPGLVPFIENIKQVTAGDSHSAALTESGSVYIWGSFRNREGDIGLKPGKGKIMNPTLIHFATDGEPEPQIVKITSGTNHVIALSADGEMFGLGDGEFGQLGRFVVSRGLRSMEGIKRENVFLEPKKVYAPSLKHVIDVWAGGCSTYCKTQGGEIWSFGLNTCSQLGWPARRPRTPAEAENFDNSLNFQFVPRKATSFNLRARRTWNQIALGEHHTLALDDEGKVFALGDSRDGRLGLVQEVRDAEGKVVLDEHGEVKMECVPEQSAPTLVPTLEKKKCVWIACGGSTSYAITDSGELYAWGFGENFQLANGKETDEKVPTLCKGSRQALGITGKVVYASGGSQHVAIITDEDNQ